MRATLERLGRDVPLRTVELPSGTQVFDWTLPREWNVREAWVEAPDGSTRDRRRRLRPSTSSATASRSTRRVELAELREHLFTDPRDPDVVPYRTSYWSERWGFCTTQSASRTPCPRGEYRVRIDATLEDGHVTYGEVVLEGESDDVFLLTTTVCHPALANDNLSGVVLLAGLARILAAQAALRHSFRLVWSPGTIGPLCWLHTNRELVERIRHGFAVSCVGDPGPLTYKRSRREDAAVDRAAEVVLRDRDGATSSTVVALRRRRAPVLLARLRPAVRRVLAHARGRVPRVPLVGRQPRTSSARRRSGDSLHAAPRDRRRPRAESRRSSTRRRTASLSSGARGLYRSLGGRIERGVGPPLGPEPRRTGTASLLDIAARSGLSLQEMRGRDGAPRGMRPAQPLGDLAVDRSVERG